MFDVVMPKNNEEEFIDMALSLGYSEIVFLTENMNYNYESKRIKIKKGFLVKSLNQLSGAKKTFDYVFANPERQFFESKIDFIINSELSERKDSFHYKRTALNQVHAKLCKEKGSTIVFSFSNLLSDNRIINLGRMFQNAMITRKYKLYAASFSIAKEPMYMKSRTTLDALLKVLGL